jgi:hypothetical protein
LPVFFTPPQEVRKIGIAGFLPASEGNPAYLIRGEKYRVATDRWDSKLARRQIPKFLWPIITLAVASLLAILVIGLLGAG